MAFSDIKEDLTECEKNLKLMETELAALSPEAKYDYLRKVKILTCRSGNIAKTSTTVVKVSTRPRTTMQLRKTRKC